MKNIKTIAYWQDGFYLDTEDAIESALDLDSVNAFGSNHKPLEVDSLLSDEAMQELVNAELLKAGI